MNNKLRKLSLTGIFVLSSLSVNIGVLAQRQRVVVKPTPSPTATPQVTPTPTPTPVQTLSFLRGKISSVLLRSELRRGNIGIKIVSQDSGKIVYEINPEKYFMPASNMKVFTVAAAIQKLSPNFKFVTSVYANAPPDESGTIKGDLTIYGRGDITFSKSFNDENDYYKQFDALADKIVSVGIKKIDGNLIGDESYFRGFSIPNSWEWDDMQWAYGAGISALSFNDNVVELKILPGPKDAPCIVNFTPNSVRIVIVNTCVSGGDKSGLRIIKRLDQDIIEVSGNIPVGNEGFSGKVAVSKSGDGFMSVLRQRLEQKGVKITGRTNGGNKPELNPHNRIELTRLESVPLSIVSQKTMKPSQNMYTETLLWALGEEIGDKTDTTRSSADKGLGVMKTTLQEMGIESDGIIQWDGSGMSRHNLVTPTSVVRVYEYMAKSPYSIAWNASLTIGAVDGTLKNRFSGTSAAANVRGKTGTIDQVSSLSGYLTSSSGEKLIFSIIINGVAQTSVRTKAIDEIVVALSDFNGKFDEQ